MELDHGTCKETKFEPIDYISNMPENVITNILDRLPIQEAVGTSILSRSWRFSWTTLTQLVFDSGFFLYLKKFNRLQLFYEKNLGQILVQHKGSLTKFVLFISLYTVFDEVINHWIQFLSKKGLKELSLYNLHNKPLKLSNHIFSRLELKHLVLDNCCVHLVPGLRCFQNLLTFHFVEVTFEGCRFKEFVTSCPLLESLTISRYTTNGGTGMNLVEIGKLKSLKTLDLTFFVLEDTAISSSDFLRCMGFLTKLEVLHLDFYNFSFLAEVGARKTLSYTWPCLKHLTLAGIDLSDKTLLLCVCDLINGSPNLQSLRIEVAYESNEDDEISDDDDYDSSGTDDDYDSLDTDDDDLSDVSNKDDDSDSSDKDDEDDDSDSSDKDDEDDDSVASCGSLEVECDIRGNLQLQSVNLIGIKGTNIEVSLIKSLLDSSSLLKTMDIYQRRYGGNANCCELSKKLLNLQRASPFAKINLIG